jgi:hypothetical protein
MPTHQPHPQPQWDRDTPCRLLPPTPPIASEARLKKRADTRRDTYRLTEKDWVVPKFSSGLDLLKYTQSEALSNRRYDAEVLDHPRRRPAHINQQPTPTTNTDRSKGWAASTTIPWSGTASSPAPSLTPTPNHGDRVRHSEGKRTYGMGLGEGVGEGDTDGVGDRDGVVPHT